jgi:hypothetical protein
MLDGFNAKCACERLVIYLSILEDVLERRMVWWI